MGTGHVDPNALTAELSTAYRTLTNYSVMAVGFNTTSRAYVPNLSGAAAGTLEANNLTAAPFSAAVLAKQ